VCCPISSLRVPSKINASILVRNSPRYEALARTIEAFILLGALSADDFPAQDLYETHYCARGEMENRIKECQLDLTSDRTSTKTLKANQLRLWLSSLAYVLIEAVRRLALEGTELAKATAGTIQHKLLKIAALVTTSVRRIKVAFASACPMQDVLFAKAHERLRALSLPPPNAVTA
ncbi:MAG: transposase, partial [Pseudomonadota bacterium]